MEKNYWLHRISYENRLSKVLLEKKNILSIGFSEFSSEEYLNRILSNSDELDNIMEYLWEGLSRNRYSLKRYLCEMKKGDYILVPSPLTFSIYEIVGDKPFTNSSLDINNLCDVWGNPILRDGDILYIEHNHETVDLGFYWNVRCVEKDIPRSEYADQALISRMKARQTTLNINDLENSINEAIRLYKEKTPINLHNLIVEKTSDKLLDLIHEKINPDKFEQLVKWYMEKLGANVEIPAKNNPEEGDVDVIAYFDSIRTEILIQVKKHEGNTDNWAVDQISSYIKNNQYNPKDYSCQLWIISTCDDFTKETIDKAQSENIRLINGKMFAEMLLDVGLNGMII